jgi:iron(III) transport system substrate-binding protein
MRSFIATLAVALSFGTASLADDISGKLVVYTSQPNQDAQATVDAFTAMHPGVEVEWIRDGTTKVMAKLRAEFEAGAPQADVLLIADMVTMEGLKAEGRLMAYPQADVSAYDPALMDDQGHYFSTKLITTGIVYNTNAPMVPTSYKDLLTPGAKNMLAMPSPLTSGAATIHMVSITEHPDLGWDYYAALADQGANPQGGNGGVYQAVAGGEKLYGFVVDFLISPEGQQLAADMGYLPAHPAITPPEGFPARTDIKLLDFDPAKALADDAANKQRFIDIFGG